MEYVIVQAGGRGSRMESLTRNKPKALVPIRNLPMIFHLFKRFPQKKFIVIGDYKYDVLEKYLNAFADVDYQMVHIQNRKGTCAGLKEALDLVPANERFMLIWCDLVLPENYSVPESTNNVVGVSRDFPCRWMYKDGVFSEERSSEHGVAGHFIFSNKSQLEGVPEEGEFVRWLSTKNLSFEEQSLYNVREYGLYSEWNTIKKMKCRPFNSIEIEGTRLVKMPLDEQGRKLAEREVAWYKYVKQQNIANIPEIYEYEPLSMEYVDGVNIYELNTLSLQEKKNVLSQVVDSLKRIHKVEIVEADRDSYYEAYVGKTFSRLEKVWNLVPFAQDKEIVVNGKKCRNIRYCRELVEKLVMQYCPKQFSFIHGDCTFSNILLKEGTIPVMIDPRGYFGKTELFGDAAYDWVKLYYSIVSNYDQFNLKKFNLEILDDEIKLSVVSNNWEDVEDDFFALLKGEVSKKQMKLLLAIVWLSLTTYTWEDYDSICGAFYQGLYYLEEALEMESAYSYFEENSKIIDNALRSISRDQMESLIQDCEQTLRSDKKIVLTGLGKNVPICEKVVGTMLSLGMNAGFMHTNTAVHGDLGMVHSGDLVIILSKSGSTTESVYLHELLKKREGIKLWLLSFKENGELAKVMANKLIVDCAHEGDLWDIVPNNSTTINLIVLQTVAIQLAKRLGLSLEDDFKPNHPGGAIGAALQYGK